MSTTESQAKPTIGADKTVLRALKKTLTNGSPLKGRVEHELIKASPQLKRLRSKWARKRGQNFQLEVVDAFNRYFEINGLSAVAYLNRTSKFAFQPYDVVVFSKDFRPIFIECKASGIGFKHGVPRLTPCARRYFNYHNNKNRIDSFYALAGAQLYYCMQPANSEDPLVFVKSRVVSANLASLKTRITVLAQSQYIKTNRDPSKWRRSLLSDLSETQSK